MGKNRKSKRARAAAKRRSKRQTQGFTSESAGRPISMGIGENLDSYEIALLSVRNGAIDPRLVIASDGKGPFGTRLSWWLELVTWDTETDDWAPTPKQRAADLRREYRENRSFDSACYESPQWVHNREERNRIDYLGTPYAAIRVEGRTWEIHHFPGEDNLQRAREGKPCEGDGHPVMTKNRTGIATGDYPSVDLDGNITGLATKGARVALSNSPLRADRPSMLKRMFEKLMAQGSDPAMWKIDSTRAARIGQPRRPLRKGEPLVRENHTGDLRLFTAVSSFNNIARGYGNSSQATRQKVAFQLAAL